MARPPRRQRDRVIGVEMLRGVAFVGLVMAVTMLLALDTALPGGLVDGNETISEARTMAFTTLVLAQLFNCFNARSDRDSAFPRVLSNPVLLVAIALSLVLQGAVVHVSLLQDAFDTSPLSARDWALCAGLASTVLWADELRKLGRRRGSGRSALRPATPFSHAAVMNTPEKWRYYVHDEQVFCPRQLREIDAGECPTCRDLRAVEGDVDHRTIVCLPPPGETPAGRLRAMLR